MASKPGPYIEGRKAYISMTLDPAQVAALDALVAQRKAEVPRTEVSRAQLLREAVDVFLRLNPPSARPIRNPEPAAVA